jgi:hypothetical protein
LRSCTDTLLALAHREPTSVWCALQCTARPPRLRCCRHRAPLCGSRGVRVYSCGCDAGAHRHCRGYRSPLFLPFPAASMQCMHTGWYRYRCRRKSCDGAMPRTPPLLALSTPLKTVHPAQPLWVTPDRACTAAAAPLVVGGYITHQH